MGKRTVAIAPSTKQQLRVERSRLTNGRWLWALAISTLVSGLTGCSITRSPSWAVASQASCAVPATNLDGPEVQRGRPQRFVDGVGWVMGIPKKILLWNHRIENHSVSPETEHQIVAFLDAQGLDETCVRINQYDPAGEWQRLRENRRVGAGWRYTMGTWHWLGYTLLPGRVFGGDRYNPYSDSLYVYSDVAPLGMVEGAYARDVKDRTRPGTYAFFQEFPVLCLWHETLATNTTLDYVAQNGSVDDYDRAVHLLYPRYGAAAGQSVEAFLPFQPFATLTGAVAGHAAGRSKSIGRDRASRIADSPRMENDPVAPGRVELAGHNRSTVYSSATNHPRDAGVVVLPVLAGQSP